MGADSDLGDDRETSRGVQALDAARSVPRTGLSRMPVSPSASDRTPCPKLTLSLNFQKYRCPAGSRSHLGYAPPSVPPRDASTNSPSRSLQLSKKSCGSWSEERARHRSSTPLRRSSTPLLRPLRLFPPPPPLPLQLLRPLLRQHLRKSSSFRLMHQCLPRLLLSLRPPFQSLSSGRLRSRRPSTTRPRTRTSQLRWTRTLRGALSVLYV